MAGGGGGVCVGEGVAIPSPILTSPLEGTGEGRGSLNPLQESKDRWGWRDQVEAELKSLTPHHVQRGGRQVTGGGGSVRDLGLR